MWGSPSSQSDTLRKLGRQFPQGATDLVVVVHAVCGNVIARLVAPQRPRWIWGPVLVSREPMEIPPVLARAPDAGALEEPYDADESDGTIDFFQLVRGLTIPGRLELWCVHCGRHDEVGTRALRAVAKRATDGTVERIRTLTPT